MVLVYVRFEGPPVFICKDMLSWYLLTLMIRRKLQTKSQVSDPVNQDHNLPCVSEVTRSVQDQNLQNHKQTRSELGQFEMVEWSPIEPRDDWVISIKDKLENALRDEDRSNWEKLCIYKVPPYLHEKDKKLYFPETISLGPYHHGEARSMECHKWRAVNMVLQRTKQDIKIYISAMKELEERARDCYEGPIGLSSNEFTEMLVLDGCFVLELFRGAENGFSKLGYGRNDPVFAMRGLMYTIQRDMVMLENQLPMFVLNRLLELQLGTHNQTGSVAQLAIRFFNPLIPTVKLSTKIDQIKTENSSENDKFFNPIADKDKEELHCLDAFRRSLLQPCLTPEPRLSRRRWSRKKLVADKRQQQLIYSVTKLRDVGIKFRRRKTDRFWDIRFNSGYLEIPKLLIHDGTKSLFSNLIAFEQCHIDSNNDITSYIIFMDNLIDSAEDVSYLHYCGIIEHWLRNDSEVADLFNRLCQEVAFDPQDSYLFKLSHKIDRHYNRKWNVLKAFLKWNVWKKSLKEKYLDSPWAYISFFAGVVLLFLTLSQSYFAAYAYYKPSS